MGCLKRPDPFFIYLFTFLEKKKKFLNPKRDFSGTGHQLQVSTSNPSNSSQQDPEQMLYPGANTKFNAKSTQN